MMTYEMLKHVNKILKSCSFYKNRFRACGCLVAVW